MIRPVPGRITPHGAYGAGRPFGIPTRRHAGIDLAAAAGARVVSPISGVVVAAEYDHRPPWRGYAPVVAVVSPDRLTLHVMSHLGRLLVRPGQAIVEGQQIATGGNLGHVHWEIRKRGVAVDPASVERPAWPLVVAGLAVCGLLGVALLSWQAKRH